MVFSIRIWRHCVWPYEGAIPWLGDTTSISHRMSDVFQIAYVEFEFLRFPLSETVFFLMHDDAAPSLSLFSLSCQFNFLPCMSSGTLWITFILCEAWISDHACHDFVHSFLIILYASWGKMPCMFFHSARRSILGSRWVTLAVTRRFFLQHCGWCPILANFVSSYDPLNPILKSFQSRVAYQP